MHRKPLIPTKVKRFDSADYFLTKHMEKQRASREQQECPSPMQRDSDSCATDFSSRPTTADSECNDGENMASLPPALTRVRLSTAIQSG